MQAIRKAFTKKIARNQHQLAAGTVYNFSTSDLYNLRQTQKTDFSNVKYVRGFRNMQFQEIALGYMPKHNNPKYPPHNLVTEQITGPQGFTGEASVGGPLKAWIYKKERSIKVGKYERSTAQPFENQQYVNIGPNPLRSFAPKAPTQPTDFLDGLKPYADNEHILHYQYSLNKSMKDDKKVFHNIDGEMLFQPSEGALEIVTELGILELQPGTIGVLTKNIKFQVNLKPGSEFATGVITELKHDRSFIIPGKGPIGSNGLAQSEYFEAPTPYVQMDNLKKQHTVVCKKQDSFWTATQNKSPFDVYAWKGNYSPYRFNLEDFVPVVAANRDHLDPSSHIVLAVGAADGANTVELVVFAPRWNCTSDKYPTYLPPWDHRNVGKSEIMHYLGGYDARKGAQAGAQTIHDMGVAHGNDQATFEKARSGKNETVFLDFAPATMVELTNSVQVAPWVLEQQDPEYHESLRGIDRPDTQDLRIPESLIGTMQRITFTALESSVTNIFDVLMPNPKITFNEKTGIQTREYRNSNGQIFQVNSQYDQNKFWELYKASKSGKTTVELEQSEIASRNPAEATTEELVTASRVIKSFLNRGTVISVVDLEVEDPEASVKYFLNRGFVNGAYENSIALNENAPLNFRLIKEGSFVAEPNPEAQVSTIDHTVINVFRNQLDSMFELFPKEFWGGDCRDLRAPGVQFDTRVLTSQLEKVKQLIPVNNLDATEEEILQRIQDRDSYLPPYIKQAAIANQITRGLMDTNRTVPTASKDAFLQHIAMAVNCEYGDITSHLANFKANGMKQIPPPPQAYYDLSEVDLSQRLLLPTLFGLVGVDAFDLPYTFFNGLLKPKDADVARLNELLVRDNEWEQSEADPIVNAYKQIQPVLEAIGDNVLEFNEENLTNKINAALKAQNINYSESDLKTIIDLISFNHKKVERAAKAGSLIDFQIIVVGGQNQTGYLDQTFSVPITQGNEGTSGIFLEFIVRTAYDEIFDLMKIGEFYTKGNTQFKSCGAFGQGNFGNLMLGQQKGIEKIDKQMKQKQQEQGFAFQLPIFDFNTIDTKPLEHYEEHISSLESEGLKAENIDSISNNIKAIVEECQKRGIW